MATRLRRVEQVERNREAVLAAAGRVFIQRGYGGASLEAIAEEAGFSKGVVYSQFGSKPDLFFAFLEKRIEDRAVQNEVAAQAGGAEGLREMMRVAAIDAAKHPGWPYVLTEFRALAMRDAELSRRYANAHQRTVDGIASVYNRLYEQAGLEPPVSVRSIAEFVLAGAAGIALERAANPDAIPDSDIAQLLSRVLGLGDEPLEPSRNRKRR
jgi:AcrR family transcriptional regulator